MELKKILPVLFILLFLFSCDFVDPDNSDDDGSDGSGSKLTLVSPNGGDTLYVASSATIKWNSQITAKVKLEITYDGGNNWILIADSVENTGNYVWDPIPNKLTSKAQIRISDITNSATLDKSDNNFSIIENKQKVVRLITPRGNEILSLGSVYDIKWVSSKINNVKIDFSSDNGATWETLNARVTASDSKYTLNPVPKVNSEKCLIKISDADDATFTPVISNPFKILAGLDIKLMILQPNGGEKVEYNKLTTIKWYTAIVKRVKIEYSTDNGQTWKLIVNDILSTGAYEWNPPNTSSGLCKIRVTDAAPEAGKPVISDESDYPFTIAGSDQIEEITILTPNGGEVLRSGGNYQITWTSKNVQFVKIEYSATNGPNWTTIIDKIESKGFYNWDNIPNVSTSLGRVRISNIDDPNDFDLSDRTFSITNIVEQSVTVVFPNGGDVFEAASTQTIRWNSSGIEKIKIEYTLNNGNSWQVIVNETANSGSYEWKLPSEASTQCKIRISDAVDGKPVDESDNTFRIKPVQSISFIKPQSGNTIILGEEYTIEWESTGIEFVDIDYTYFDGTSEVDWTTVARKLANSGKYKITFTKPSEGYKLRIRDSEDGSPIATVGPFTVKASLPREINLEVPNGGEKWLAGQTYEIRWQASYTEFIKIQYTLDQYTWHTIVEKYPNIGTYNWKVPADIKTKTLLAKFRISNPSDSTFFDLSDSYFTIYPPKYLRVLFPNGFEYINADIYKPGEKIPAITWESAGIAKVKIELSLNNGTSWDYVISPSMNSTGAYGWADFYTYPPSALARIRITDVSADADPVNPEVDVNDSFFYLNIAKGVNLEDSQRSLKTSASLPIRWQGAKNVGFVDIEYTTDNGKNWNTIAKGIINNPYSKNEYVWKNIPSNLKGTIKYRLKTGNNAVVSKEIKIIK